MIFQKSLSVKQRTEFLLNIIMNFSFCTLIISAANVGTIGMDAALFSLAIYMISKPIIYSIIIKMRLDAHERDTATGILKKIESQLANILDTIPATISKNNETKYGSGVLPIDTYKSAVDNLIEHNERLPWDLLRTQLKATGIRNSTLMALMPAETSAQISNSTNGIEPPRALVSYKQSKDGVMAQVVPGYHHLKNKYDLLWDQKSPDGYLKICAILQKYIDQGISVNTSYNPEHFEDNKIPMSEMIKDTVTAYKYGLKQLYYFNTFDGSGEITDEATHHSYEGEAVTYEDDDCESCKI